MSKTCESCYTDSEKLKNGLCWQCYIIEKEIAKAEGSGR